MEVERIEPQGTASWRVVLKRSSNFVGLTVKADITSSGGRLVVTQLAVSQDQFGRRGNGTPSEVTRDSVRSINPPAIIRAFTDYLATNGDLVAARAWFQANGLRPADPTEMRAFFQAHNSPTGLRQVDAIESGQVEVRQLHGPRGPGRPQKFTHKELIHWAQVALKLDATQPKSLHRVLAEAMADSDRADLRNSSPANARDLLRRLRDAGLLMKSRKGGAREPLAAGPLFPMKD